MTNGHIRHLGPIARDDQVESSMAPFYKVAVRTAYPKTVVIALCDLYVEYCDAMRSLEGSGAYPLCNPAAFAVQIDMKGLCQDTLDMLSAMPVEEVREVLRGLVFEIDSSIAMTPLLSGLFAAEDGTSAFGTRWTQVLDDLRSRNGMPIVLLAPTQEKYEAIVTTEFAADPGDWIDPETVKRLTGFDGFFGPDEFAAHVQVTNGAPQYQFFVRASDPVEKLRRPGTLVDHPILGNDMLREVLQQHSATMNVDDPSTPHLLSFNDTKRYMPQMGLGFVIEEWEELGGDAFELFLKQRGVDEYGEDERGTVQLRAKPVADSYGAYGHVRGVITDKKFRAGVKSGLRKRGPYVIQPELPVSMVEDPTTGIKAGYIDRLFIGSVGGEPFPICGFRNYMPEGSTELDEGRIHGNGEAFWEEILLSA